MTFHDDRDDAFEAHLRRFALRAPAPLPLTATRPRAAARRSLPFLWAAAAAAAVAFTALLSVERPRAPRAPAPEGVLTQSWRSDPAALDERLSRAAALGLPDPAAPGGALRDVARVQW
jgi:hypothetical protein